MVDTMLSKIDNLLKELNNCRPLNSDEVARLRDEFLVEFTYDSNAIEGSTLTLQETALIINEGITIAEKPLREHLEVVGHKEAYLYVVDLVKEKTPITERVIKDIHNIILMDKPKSRGVYRNLPVRVMGADNEVAQPYMIEPLMQDLIKSIEANRDKHIVEQVALFHLKFESIHPFLDGNGRTGRLLLNLELMKNGIPPINIKFANRRKYYDCFKAYHSENGSANEMIELIGGYVVEAIENYLSILK